MLHRFPLQGTAQLVARLECKVVRVVDHDRHCAMAYPKDETPAAYKGFDAVLDSVKLNRSGQRSRAA
jgi:hypothetical protein